MTKKELKDQVILLSMPLGPLDKLEDIENDLANWLNSLRASDLPVLLELYFETCGTIGKTLNDNKWLFRSAFNHIANADFRYFLGIVENCIDSPAHFKYFADLMPWTIEAGEYLVSRLKNNQYTDDVLEVVIERIAESDHERRNELLLQAKKAVEGYSSRACQMVDNFLSSTVSPSIWRS